MSQDELPLDSMLEQAAKLSAEEVAHWQAAGKMARLAGASILILVTLLIGILAYLAIFKDHDFVSGLRYYRFLDFVDLGLLVISMILLVISGLRCIGFAQSTEALRAGAHADNIMLPADQLRLIFTLLATVVMLMLARWIISTVLN